MVNDYSITTFRGQSIITNRSNIPIKTINVSADKCKGKFKIVGELVDRYETVGYILEHTNGKRVDIDNRRVIEYIHKGFVQGVKIDTTDNTVIFNNTEDIYNIDVSDIRTKNSIRRISLFLDSSECVYDINTELTAIGQLDIVAYEKDIYMLNKDIKLELSSFTYGDMKLLNLTKHRIRIYNTSQIFDIRYKENLYSMGRNDIVKLILNGVAKFDINTDKLSISTYNNTNQLLARYTLKLNKESS
jgi:hypothetical protein